MDSYHEIIKVSHALNPRCPICNQKYEVQKIQILDKTASGILSYFKCDKCLASFLATVTETPFGHLAQGLLTDLEAEEVLEFARHEAVTHDDVIEIHEKMERGKFTFDV